MNYNLPSPPRLKTTIIQLNKDLDQDNGNFEILTNDYNQQQPDIDPPPSPQLAKKRRRSNSNVNQEELAKRKFETKQLHLIIEKRRRIKINREFEALKYLIPACRVEGNSSLISTGPGNSPNLAAKKSNNSKIDGMYKLTILKSSVEYILYLHHLIKQQHQIIQSYNSDFLFDTNFTEIPLNVNEYRNIDKDFDFKPLINDFEASNSPHNPSLVGDLETMDLPQGSVSSSSSSSSSSILPSNNPSMNNLNDINNTDDMDSFQLPSPIITPDIPPSRFKYTSKFQLPDPAVGVLPKKKYFKSLPKDLVINEDDEESATKTLLSLRKSLIDNLLN